MAQIPASVQEYIDENGGPTRMGHFSQLPVAAGTAYFVVVEPRGLLDALRVLFSCYHVKTTFHLDKANATD